LRFVAAVALVTSLPGFFMGTAPATCSLFTVIVAVFVLFQRRRP
jgi:hypothetical protein